MWGGAQTGQQTLLYNACFQVYTFYEINSWIRIFSMLPHFPAPLGQYRNLRPCIERRGERKRGREKKREGEKEKEREREMEATD